MIRMILLIPVVVLFLVIAASVVLEQGKAFLADGSLADVSSGVSGLIAQLPLVGGPSPEDIKESYAAISAALASGDDAALTGLDLDPAVLKSLQSQCEMMAFGFGLPAEACAGAVATVVAMDPGLAEDIETNRRVEAVRTAMGDDAELGVLSGGLAGALAAGGLGASVSVGSTGSVGSGSLPGVANAQRVRPDDGRRNIGARFVKPEQAP